MAPTMRKAASCGSVMKPPERHAGGRPRPRRHPGKTPGRRGSSAPHRGLGRNGPAGDRGRRFRAGYALGGQGGRNDTAASGMLPVTLRTDRPFRPLQPSGKNYGPSRPKARPLRPRAEGGAALRPPLQAGNHRRRSRCAGEGRPVSWSASRNSRPAKAASGLFSGDRPRGVRAGRTLPPRRRLTSGCKPQVLNRKCRTSPSFTS